MNDERIYTLSVGRALFLLYKQWCGPALLCVWYIYDLLKACTCNHYLVVMKKWEDVKCPYHAISMADENQPRRQGTRKYRHDGDSRSGAAVQRLRKGAAPEISPLLWAKQAHFLYERMHNITLPRIYYRRRFPISEAAFFSSQELCWLIFIIAFRVIMRYKRRIITETIISCVRMTWKLTFRPNTCMLLLFRKLLYSII